MKIGQTLVPFVKSSIFFLNLIILGNNISEAEPIFWYLKIVI
jgi:hypothetical protein